MSKIWSFIQRVPWFLELLHFLRKPRLEFARWRDYLRFRRSFGRVFSSPLQGPVRGRLLVMNPLGDWIASMQLEAFFVNAAHMKGMEPYIVTNRGVWANRYYRLFGIRKFIYLEDHLRKVKQHIDPGAIDQVLRTIQSFEELMHYEYHGVKIGKYVCSSLLRRTYGGSIDLNSVAIQNWLRGYLDMTMTNTLAAEDIYKSYVPGAVLLNERGYTPFGEFFDLAIRDGLNVVQWCGGHKDNAFILKRYFSATTDQHHTSLSSKTWEMLKALPWDVHRARAVEHELFRTYASGEWFAEVGTQFHTQMLGREKIQNMLGFDSAKKTAVIFSHIFWDATFFWGEDLFRDYQEWFVESVKAACKNTNVNWIIKFHPANIIKMERDGHHGELIEHQTIRDYIGVLPPHIKILEPSTEISTYSLIQSIDYCVTVRGTVGIEAALFGVPVFTAGTGRFDRRGFTIDARSREEYLAHLAQIHTYPRLTPVQIELAQKFAYGIFMVRPFVPTSISVWHKRDARATLQVNYHIHSREELMQTPDIKALGAWLVDSREEDYLDVSKL